MNYSKYSDAELSDLSDSLKKDFLNYKRENKTFDWKEAKKDIFEIMLIIKKRVKLKNYNENILPKLLKEKEQIKKRLKETSGSNKEDHLELKKVKEKLRLGIYAK